MPRVRWALSHRISSPACCSLATEKTKRVYISRCFNTTSAKLSRGFHLDENFVVARSRQKRLSDLGVNVRIQAASSLYSSTFHPPHPSVLITLTRKLSAPSPFNSKIITTKLSCQQDVKKVLSFRSFSVFFRQRLWVVELPPPTRRQRHPPRRNPRQPRRNPCPPLHRLHRLPLRHRRQSNLR